MPKQLIVSHICYPQVAILDDGRLCRLLSDKPSAQTGDIYLAKVVRLLPSLMMAFLDIGEPKNAVLTLTKDSQIRQGQYIMVMIGRPAYAQKGATATTAISLSSPYVVYKPDDMGVRISHKIPKNIARHIKHAITAMMKDEHLQGGIIIRTSAQTVDIVTILEHIGKLHQTEQHIKNHAHKKPCRLYRVPLPLSVFVYDTDSKKIDEILIDDKTLYDEWCDFVGQFLPHLTDKIKYRTPSLFDSHDIYAQLCQALSPYVPLSSGATLVIDECEAMTVVDVNTGSLVNSSKNLIYQANLEASQAIAFELKLRQIAGLVVIDFIDMKNTQHQQAVYDNLKKHLADDPAKIRLLPFNEFGLVQLSRERTSLRLSDMYAEPCSACQGDGITTQKTSVLAIIAQLTTFAHQHLSSKDEIVLRVSNNLAKILLNSMDFVKIQTTLHEQLSLKIINTYCDDKYDILFHTIK